jgi:hypothetical protein
MRDGGYDSTERFQISDELQSVYYRVHDLMHHLDLSLLYTILCQHIAIYS